MINRKCGNGRIVSRERPVCPRFVPRFVPGNVPSVPSSSFNVDVNGNGTLTTSLPGIYLVQGQATVNGKGNCVPADAAGVILSPPTALQDLKQNFQQ